MAGIGACPGRDEHILTPVTKVHEVLGHTPKPISAHVRHGAIGVVDDHAYIGILVGLQNQDTVGSNASMTVTQGSDQFGAERMGVLAIIQKDKIVSQTLVFCELVHAATLSP